jgi:hypothetical protein
MKFSFEASSFTCLYCATVSEFDYFVSLENTVPTFAGSTESNGLWVDSTSTYTATSRTVPFTSVISNGVDLDLQRIFHLADSHSVCFSGSSSTNSGDGLEDAVYYVGQAA